MLAIITGGSKGLGACIKRRLLDLPCDICNWDLETGVDVTSEAAIIKAVREINLVGKPINAKVDVLINCAGYNYLNWTIDIPVAEWEKVLNVNARGIFLTAKYLAPIMVNGTICNIISNASHVPMTHSLAYNASKAAAAMMTRQMAKELWSQFGITVFGVSPGKMKSTAMTAQVDKRAAELRGMTQAQAHEYQLSKILVGEEIEPDTCAEFICWLLAAKQRHKHLAGCIMEYGA